MPKTTRVETELRYDDGRQALAVGCIDSTSGICHLTVDQAGARRTYAIPEGATRTLTQISSGARTCGQIDPAQDVARCEWTPVQPKSPTA